MSCPVDHSKQDKCPVDHSNSKINPLNMMPNLPQTMSKGQAKPLSTDREISSIPRPNSTDGNWEYPSPQQFYNALQRKGKGVPEDSVDTMVDIHNFLNEECWKEIIKWEEKYHCDCQNVTLEKFQGKPDQLSPLALFYTTFLGAEKPFDRHDWTINRCGEKVRYVIDYYGGESDSNGNPTFSADVRPALDSPRAIFDRLRDGFEKLVNKLR